MASLLQRQSTLLISKETLHLSKPEKSGFMILHRGPRRHLNGLHRVVKANFTNHSLYTTRAQLLNLA